MNEKKHQKPDPSKRFGMEVIPSNSGRDVYEDDHDSFKLRIQKAAEFEERTGEHAIVPPEVAQGLGGGALSGAEVYGQPAPPVLEAGPGELPPEVSLDDLPSAMEVLSPPNSAPNPDH